VGFHFLGLIKQAVISALTNPDGEAVLDPRSALTSPDDGVALDPGSRRKLGANN